MKLSVIVATGSSLT